MDKKNITLQKQNKATNTHDGTEKRNTKKRFLFGLSAVLVTVLIILLVFGGVFYVIIRNNINGFADIYGKQIRAIPVLKHALPKVEDPEDPKYLTDAEIRRKYKELLQLRDDLRDQLSESQKNISELQKQIDDSDGKLAEAQAIKDEARNKIAEAEQKLKALDEDRYKFQEKVAKKDSSGFIEFYKGIDKSNAEKFYTDILKDKKADDEMRSFVQIYESMEPKSAANILEQMGDSKLDLVVDIMKNMKKEPCAAVLAEMSPKYASKVSENLSKIFMKSEEENETANAE